MRSFLLIALFFSIAFAQDRPRTEHWKLRNQLFQSELDTIHRNGVVFLGNSIIEGFDLDFYFPGQQLINRGIGGDHLDGLIERLNNSALALKPVKLFLMIGINDIGDQRSDEYLQQMYTTLIDTLLRELPETRIYIHSLLPTTARWKNCPPDQIKRINSFLMLLAIKKDLGFINLYPFFLDNTQYLNPKLTRDGLHPNQVGYALWTKKIRSLVEQVHR